MVISVFFFANVLYFILYIHENAFVLIKQWPIYLAFHVCVSYSKTKVRQKEMQTQGEKPKHYHSRLATREEEHINISFPDQFVL